MLLLLYFLTKYKTIKQIKEVLTMNWYIKTGIKIQREKTVTDKAYKELVELLNKYNTSLVSLKIISNWSITD